MAIKKIEIRPQVGGEYPDVLYPKTSADQVEGLQALLDGKATSTQGTKADDVYNRFSPHAQTLTDWNTATKNGMFMGNSASNAPSTGWFIGEVIAHNDLYVIQKVSNFNGKLTFQRVKENGVWTSWQETSNNVVYDKASSSGYPDPNTLLDRAFITDHANVHSAGSAGGHWFVEQIFYATSGASANRSQIARSYSGGVADMKTRHYNNGVWSPWSPSMQSLFNSVSNGKSAVANAITQKGIWTAPDAEFATMANNIMAIAGGKQVATGITLSNSATVLQVNTLNFIPAIVGIWVHRSTGSESQFGLYVGASLTNIGYNVNAMSSSGINHFGNFTALSNGFSVTAGSQTQFGWVAISY